MIPSILRKEEGKINTASETTGKDLRMDRIIEFFEDHGKYRSNADVFIHPLNDRENIIFRQEVMKDFENTELRNKIRLFANNLRSLEAQLEKMQHIKSEQLNLIECSNILLVVKKYCEEIERFPKEITPYIESEGMKSILTGIHEYINGEQFHTVKIKLGSLYESLQKIQFCMLIKDGSFKIRPSENEKCVEDEIAKIFMRFVENSGKIENNSRCGIRNASHIDEAVLKQLSKWYGKEMENVRIFAGEYRDIIDSEILQFAEEVFFYIRWQDMISPLREKGLKFCYPKFSDREQIYCEEGFDLALGLELIGKNKTIVSNSFYLKNDEKVIIVSGPNQGGKTTFARSFGQAFYLASLGCSIPGAKAVMRCSDRIFTHFEKEETRGAEGGKLQDDISRLHEIMKEATSESVLVINEIYSSTTLQDAVYLGTRMMEEISQKGCIAICVTFLDELADYDEHTVSMMSTRDEATRKRSYKIVRKTADGVADAMSLATYYGLDYQCLKRRLL